MKVHDIIHHKLSIYTKLSVDWKITLPHFSKRAQPHERKCETSQMSKNQRCCFVCFLVLHIHAGETVF